MAQTTEQKITRCIETLKGIERSGYIPFTSPHPCSTEREIKDSLVTAREKLEHALKKHHEEFGKKKDHNPFRLANWEETYTLVSEFVSREQGAKGFINTYSKENDTIWAYRYEEHFGDTAVKEYEVIAVAFMDNELCVLLEDNMTDEKGKLIPEYTDEAIKERLDRFESVRWSDIMYLQTLYDIAECIEEYAD